ncbi:hypothetical protein RN001_012476 [Aquatica leii]|uniref:DUF4806 domain-containing protein n=1 Tax=Aquatica leii TaxID=1421715 RepID=A0AAN7P345_9COLE|nr:hypothetical protein RN001_012476 [Aquatica leii]
MVLTSKTLVRFIIIIEENSVEAVPTKWIIKGMCYWPPYPKKDLLHAIEYAEDVNFSWEQHKVFSFRNNVYDNYDEAVRKSKRATVTSDLDSQSDYQEGSPKKRKVIKKTFSTYFSFEEDEENCEPQRKILKKPPKLKLATEDSILNKTEVIQNGSAVAIHTSANISVNGGYIKNVFEKILHKQNIIWGTLPELVKDVQELKQSRKTVNGNSVGDSRETIFMKFTKFPVDNDEDLLDLAFILSDTAELNKAVIDLSKVGGSTPCDFIYRLSKQLIKNQFAARFSWLRKKQNKPLVEEMQREKKLICIQCFV